MWLTTTQGFYSAVAHRDLPGILLVRSRAREDLVNLDKQIPGLAARIDYNEHADYCWRVAVSTEEWALAVARLATTVDYDNFKNAVAARQGHERAGVYHRVWDAITAIEPGFRARYYGQWRKYDSLLGLDDLPPLADHREDALLLPYCEACGEELMVDDEGCPWCYTPRTVAEPPVPSRSLTRSQRKRRNRKARKQKENK